MMGHGIHLENIIKLTKVFFSFLRCIAELNTYFWTDFY